MEDRNTHLSARDRPATSFGLPGVGMTTFTNADNRSLLELLTVATERALADAALDSREVDSVHVANMAAEAFNDRSGLANALASSVSARNASARRTENTSASGASAFLDAVDSVRSGRSDVALAVGGEKMSAADTSKRPRSSAASHTKRNTIRESRSRPLPDSQRIAISKRTGVIDEAWPVLQ